MLNILWVVVASLLYLRKLDRAEAAKAVEAPRTTELAGV
jgi:hypothetical protein